MSVLAAQARSYMLPHLTSHHPHLHSYRCTPMAMCCSSSCRTSLHPCFHPSIPSSPRLPTHSCTLPGALGVHRCALHILTPLHTCLSPLSTRVPAKSLTSTMYCSSGVPLPVCTTLKALLSAAKLPPAQLALLQCFSLLAFLKVERNGREGARSDPRINKACCGQGSCNFPF